MHPLYRAGSKRLWGICLLAVLGAGCATHRPMVGPDYQPPSSNPPASWHGAVASAGLQPASPAALAQWWRVLGDAQLDALVEQALVANGDLRLAAARLREARAARLLARAGLFPSVSGFVSPTRRSAAASDLRTTSTLYQAGFDAAWEIDLFGKNGRTLEAANADLEASQAALENVKVSLVAEVVQACVDLRNYQRRLAIARENLASQGETVRIAQWRNQAGLVSTSDVDQAVASREQTRATIPDLETAIASARNRLAVLLGQQPGAVQPALMEARPLPTVPDSVAVGIPADALRARPDLAVAERTLAAETARVGAQLAQRFPSLSLSGSIFRQGDSLGALGTTGTLMRTAAGSLAATLFDGGRLRSAVEVRSAVQEQALIAYQNAVLSALAEVEDALAAYAAARDRLAARSAAADAAGRAATTSRQLYQSGLSDFQRLLDAERTRLSAQDALASAQAAQLSALVTLYKALGGGWQQASVQAPTPGTASHDSQS